MRRKAMDKSPDFYMSSTESDLFEKPRKCFELRRLSDGVSRDDLMLIRIDPPIRGQLPETKDDIITEVVIASHFDGRPLYPKRRWPIPVYVGLPVGKATNIQSNDIIETSAGPFYLAAWAELYPTEEAARNKKM
jgi:hypothetical protein